ncbi:hypothetical protein [uncultured Tenacibaculum sp.]|uniref:leucine-rich repeat domain-containing protein n=1 Tax=uncultured Tenacibaculum sp. TaxID=174713 RepID=UPI002629EC48|nr:hypothetical protein [uncultured Tenacibaculum sp.]
MKKKQLLIASMFLCFFANSFAQINFPDPNFKNALLTHSPAIDTNGNSQIEISEALAVVRLELDNKNISNLEGIEYFTNLEILKCSDNNIKEINTETLTKLRFIVAERNQIKSIDVRNCIIWGLRLDGNPLEYAYLTGNSTFQIESVYGVYFNLSKIKYVCISQAQYNVQANNVDHRGFWDQIGSALHIGECTIQTPPTGCPIINFPDPNFKQAILKDKSIDTDGDGEICIDEAEKVIRLHLLTNSNITDITGIEYFINLEGISLGYNNLPTVDLSKNIKLHTLYIENCNLTHIDLKKNINLKYIRIGANPIKNIDLSLNKKLLVFSAYNNQLTNLNTSNLTNLRTIVVGWGTISELNTDNCTSLEHVDAWENLITKLDFTTNINLNSIRIYNNLFSEIDVRNCKLKQLSVENNPNLEKVYATGNHSFYTSYAEFIKTSGVDVSNCPKLKFICVNNVSFFNNIKTYITNMYPSCVVSTDCSNTTPVINFNTYFNLSPNPTTGAMWLKRKSLKTSASFGHIYNAQTGALVKSVTLFKDGRIDPFDETDRNLNPIEIPIPIGDQTSVFIDVRDLQNGTYIFKVYSSLGQFSTTFIRSSLGEF